ncbi:MAG: ABC transporter ATP-binding protein [Tissierellia bacterium]|nr:ABC transporter ATP-binding protein [Tissierellia bacterium]
MKKINNFKGFIIEQKWAVVSCIVIAIIGVVGSLFPFYIVYKLLYMLYEKTATEALVIRYSLLAMLGFIINIIGHNISTIISHKTAFKILERMRLVIVEKMVRLPLGTMEMKGSGYFKNLLIDEIERLEYPLAHAIPEVTANLLLPTGIIIVVFLMDWRMGLAIFIPIFLTLIIYFPMYSGIMSVFENTYYKAIENMNSKVIEYIIGIKEIKIFGRSKDAYSKYEESIDNYRDATLRLYNKMYYVSSPAFILLSSTLAGVIIVGGSLYVHGRLPFHMLLFTMIVAVGIGSPILKFLEFMDNLFHIKNGNRLLKEVLNLEELHERNKMRVDLPHKDIVLENVSFAYGDSNVLHDVDLIFKENQKTALVGPSGSGKSTIANLLARFWDVRQGTITLGGVNYRDIPLSQLMENINYVTQDPFLFNISIKENIRMGKQDATDEEVYEAAKQALCHDFIMALQEGYDTLVGHAGAKLSGGQRQRIIIARAILRNAPILILDEATAFADMENQEKLQKSIQALCKEKTLIIIAHRLATISKCDQIIVMNRGEVEDVGTHEGLLASSPLYQQLWNIFMANNSTHIIEERRKEHV